MQLGKQAGPRPPGAAPCRRRRQGGVAAIEFAMVLPVLVALVLGIVYYGMVLALEQVLTLAAAEGARAALRYPPGAVDGSPSATRAERVAAAADTALAALPDSIRSRLLTSHTVATAADCAAPAQAYCVKVTLQLPTDRLLPALPLVPLPSTLTGSAVAQLSPDW